MNNTPSDTPVPADEPPIATRDHQLIAAFMAMRAELGELQQQHHTDSETIRDLNGTVDELNGRVRKLETTAEQLAELFDKIDAHAEAAPSNPADDGPAETETSAQTSTEAVQPLDIRLLIAWVRENVTKVLERKIATNQAPYWCPRWWQHPEAIARFEAARRCWVEAIISPGSALVVYFEHLDHQLDVLMSPVGPFSHCADRQHTHSPSRLRLSQDEPSDEFFLCYDRALAPDREPTTSTTPAEAAPPAAYPVTASSGSPRLRPTPWPRTSGRIPNPAEHNGRAR